MMNGAKGGMEERKMRAILPTARQNGPFVSLIQLKQ